MDTGFAGDMSGLPDPESDRDFYVGVATRRLAAWIIDAVLILLIGVPLALIFGVATLGFGFVLFPMILLGVSFAYRTLTIAGGSATWGMRFVGIELRLSDGSRFGFAAAAVHTAAYLVCFAVFVLQFISCVMIAGTRYGQGLPDLLLGSTAIHRPVE